MSSSTLYLLAAFSQTFHCSLSSHFRFSFVESRRQIVSSSVQHLFTSKREISIKRSETESRKRGAVRVRNGIKSVRWESRNELRREMRGVRGGTDIKKKKRCGIKLEKASDMHGIPIKRLLTLWKNRLMSYKCIRRITKHFHETYRAFAYSDDFGCFKISPTKRKIRASSWCRKVLKTQRVL